MSTTQQEISFYKFGPFRLDLQRYLLSRDGEPIQLSPKALKTLLVLIQNRDRVVSKDELLKSIWPDAHVEESNLAQNIFVIRKVLAEETSHRYILTIPGNGYRFVAQVEEVAGDVAVESSTSELIDSPLARAGTLIAVLPFKCLGTNSTDEFLGLGLADALITRLSNLKKIRVRPTSSVLRYREVRDDLTVIGRELKVDALLDGVFQRAGDQIRVSVQFIRVADGVTLWAAKFDEQFTNILSIQDSISEQVAGALAIKISGEEQRQLRKNYTASSEAFQHFIRGRYFWNQRTLEGLRKSISSAEQAIAVDPTYAPAYVGLADAYNLLAGHGGLAPRETFPKARAAAMIAQEIDPSLAETYASLAFINYRFDWRFDEAEQNFQKAIQLKPNYSTAHHWYGEALASAGRFEESLTALVRSQEFDPLSLPISTDLAQTFYFSRRYEECKNQLRKTLEMDPHFIRAHIVLGAALEQMGRYDEALESLTHAVELSKNNSFAVSGLGHLYASMGKKSAAKDTLRLLRQQSSEHYSSPYNIAVVYAGLGDKDNALTYLEQAVEERDVWLVWLPVTPRFEVLHDDKRFVKLLARVRPA
jgi:DNA-binding winged helix-turn-helix (wHTH) protein/tetratricopeptide (TPR) repeat protein